MTEVTRAEYWLPLSDWLIETWLDYGVISDDEYERLRRLLHPRRTKANEGEAS